MVGSEAIKFFIALSLRGFLEGGVGHAQPALVGNVFAHREVAIGMNIIGNDFGTILSTKLVGKHLELLGIFFGPPVDHVAIGIEIATLVVKAVSHFMTNHHTN
ncbi:Uncharacterised protein [Chlamydia trachomatis]|nr:Uncharacterised protein [Chlamydia trachomatis]